MAIKTPICAFDAKTGILCPKCEARLKGGHISEIDVEASIKLTKLAEKVPELDKVSLIRAQVVDDVYLLTFAAGNLNILRANPSLHRSIDEAMGGKTMLIEAGSTDRKMLEDIFYPVRILTVNVVWLPDGSKLTKVIIPGRKTGRFPLDVELIKKVVKAVRNIDLLVEFEHTSYAKAL